MFILLCELGDAFQAEILRGRLAVEGIQCVIHTMVDPSAVGAGASVNKRGVRVEVLEKDLDRAIAMMAEDQKKLDQAGPWECLRCHEENGPAFELCWSCQKRRDAPSA